MKAKNGVRTFVKTQRTAQVRATICFPPDVHETVESVARGKEVSPAWVVREATEKYIKHNRALFANGAQSS